MTKKILAVTSTLFCLSTHSNAGELSKFLAEIETNSLRGSIVAVETSFEDCTIRVQRERKGRCDQPNKPDFLISVIDLKEVAEISHQPSVRDSWILEFKLSVPQPNVVLTLIDRLTQTEDEAFRRYIERSKALLENSNFSTKEGSIDCEGVSYFSQQTSLSFFYGQELFAYPSLIDAWKKCLK